MKTTTRTALAGVPLSLALLVAGACSDDGDDSAGESTTSTEATTTAPTSSSSSEDETTASSTTPPPSSETTVPPSTDPPSPTQDTAPPPTDDGTEGEFGNTRAAQLVRAWGAGDRDRALELATPEAVDALFAEYDPGGDDWELISCEGAAGTYYCEFHSASKDRTLTVRQPNVPLEDTGEPGPIGGVEFD
jgi:hypothetical protein